MSDGQIDTQPPHDDEQRQAYIDALLYEASNYAAAGRDERVAEVNAELQRVGGEPFKAERATSKQAAKRQTR